MTTKELFSEKYDRLREEFLKDLSCFLKPYTNEVINKVITKIDFIIENDYIANMLRELRIREEKEYSDFSNSLSWRVSEYIYNNNYDMSYDLHNHPLEHASSYRNVLYDLLIRY